MQKFMKNKKGLIIVLIIIIVFVALGIWFLNLVYPNSSKSKYGNRLKDIDKYPISETKISTIKNNLKENTSVLDVNYQTSGRILTFILKTSKDADLVSLKDQSTKILENFDESELSYYDIQVIINNEDSENGSYPAFGYKHRTEEAFIWSNNG